MKVTANFNFEISQRILKLVHTEMCRSNKDTVTSNVQRF
jgi:hypothetical protein